MSSLTLLLPPRARMAQVPALVRASGTLARWWARGDRAADAAAGRDAQLREQFVFSGTTVPVAALTRELDAGDAIGSTWLRADPAHARADLTTARLMACGDLGLGAEECAALLQPLKPLFGDAGFPIDAPVPQRWYLRCPPGAQLPAFAPPSTVLGDDLGMHLPAGPEGRRWRGLFNEAQIVLHQHPLNAERTRKGLPAVNALWFWGAGQLPQWVKCAATAVLSDDVVVQALAARAGLMALPAQPKNFPADRGEVLLDLALSRDADATERWIDRVDDALRRRRFDAVRLSFESGERVQVTRGQRWRFWRRLVALPA